MNIILLKLEIEQQRQQKLFDIQTMMQLQSGACCEEALFVDLKKLREQQRITVGIHDIYGQLYKEAGFENILCNCVVSKRVLKDIVLARLSRPCSKLASVDILEKDFGIHYSVEQVYRMMDRLDDVAIDHLQSTVWQHTRTLIQQDALIMFYDCTTLHFESFTADELRDFGFSKAHLGNQTQVLLALMVTQEGLPMGYEVFKGNTYEGHTLRTTVEKLKQKYGINRAIIVADSALLWDENIKDLQEHQLEYVVGARLKNLSKSWQNKILDNVDYIKQVNEKDTLRISNFEYQPNRRLIVSHSENRANKDRYEREKTVEKVRKQLKANKNPKNLVKATGGKKYIKVLGEAQLVINEDKIQQEVQWDGLHGVFTNICDINPESILSHYHGLWQVEESFRIDKQDIRIRPIFHWTKSRIEAHLAICYLAFALIRFMQNKLRIAKVKLSPDQVKQSLNRVQKSILRHIQTQKLYVIPSKLSHEAKSIYDAFNKKYSMEPYQLKPPE